MARATTKTDLIATSQKNYAQLRELIASFTPTEQEGSFAFSGASLTQAHWERDQNIRDVIAHLYEWQVLLLAWVKANQAGASQPFLKAGYNWRNYAGMNEEFWTAHQKDTLEEMLACLDQTHGAVMALAESFSNEELFAKNVFPWVGGTTLGSYFTSNMASHYEWALKKIKKYQRSLH